MVHAVLDHRVVPRHQPSAVLNGVGDAGVKGLVKRAPIGLHAIGADVEGGREAAKVSCEGDEAVGIGDNESGLYVLKQRIAVRI